MRNLPFAQGGRNGFLQIPQEVTVFFKKPFLSIKIALQCVKGTPWKAASHKTDIRRVEERQQSRQEESEVTSERAKQCVSGQDRFTSVSTTKMPAENKR